MVNVYLLVMAMFLWGLLHSLLASLKVKALFARLLGERSKRFYRLVYNIFAGVSFLPILGLIFILPDKQVYAIPKPWMAFSLLAQILSILVLVIGLKQTGAVDFLGLNVFLGEVKPERQNLNSRGLYRYVRHPLYSAGLVFLWCSPVMTANTLLVSVCLSIYIPIGAYFEERKLLIEYGETYRNYRQKVPMLIPGLKWNK
jgi:protein-S-isoprenylcysteine O-methyltransferase Ste14